jgi:hypothetical protein
MHWLSLPAKYLLRDNSPDDDAVALRFGNLRDGFDVTACHGYIQVSPCKAETTPQPRSMAPAPSSSDRSREESLSNEPSRSGFPSRATTAPFSEYYHH